MTKIDIFSGFLGAGKTTLIKKLIKEAYAGEKLVLIENEFGEIGIDGGFMRDSGVTINEINSGCICCSLVGDFGNALTQVISDYNPDRIIIEPSGVGKLSDVIRAVQKVVSDKVVINACTTVVDASKCAVYMKNFGEFFNNQIENAAAVILSHAEKAGIAKTAAAAALVKEHNGSAAIITTPLSELDGKQILASIEHRSSLEDELSRLAEDAAHSHHDDDDDDDEHHHHHNEEIDEDEDDDDDECECEHHHHHDEDDDECEHHHHHDDDDDSCEHHHHHHEGHHHADEIFVSWGIETPRSYTKEQIAEALAQLGNEDRFGMVLRAKGIVADSTGGWIHFDYVPGEPDVRSGSAETTGRLCVIGSKLNEPELAKLFEI